MAKGQKIPAAGDHAPDFTLPDQDGTEVSLKTLRGSWVVLYFYPRDSTPGCTTEAIDFTARADRFRTRDALIIGVSPDSCESHLKFVLKLDLGVRLLSDPEKKVLSQYGAWGTKMMYGKKSTGVIRSTFLIDPEGIVRHVWGKVKVGGHAEEVLQTLAGLTER